MNQSLYAHMNNKRKMKKKKKEKLEILEGGKAMCISPQSSSANNTGNIREMEKVNKRTHDSDG
jgi:hypothetical protein